MANNGTYGGGDRNSSNTSDVEYANDPASGGFFNSDYKKHDDLKQMLDMNKDSMKLEAMKRIIGMIAKGRDASGLFPAVVKNVVSKNIEVKKLVYVYLVRYAEQQQDLALLSISTFQRALKDPNQLIRGSALRVLSSIRVPMIVPIVMLAIKESAADLSSYVRKTVAHAIPKLYCLDPEQKEELILVINKLLSDKATLVVGSAVMAFEEVCPERIDLIHKNFRKLCSVLVDVDEWGQVIIVNMLTRYARTQFADPNLNDDYLAENDRAFYTDDDDSASEQSNSGRNNRSVLDSDHKTLLRSARPLLQSRNAAVVMSVAQLYHHVAPKSDVTVVAKSLIRLLRSHREVQSVVLNSIASISIARKDVFEPFLKSFFVRTSEPTHIKILKLEILTNLATESTISVILREFQTYVTSSDKQFVAATIQAIGRCASNISEVKESCLNGLVLMLSKKDEAVVAESVVVIKKLLQTHPSSHTDIIKQMAKLSDNIMVPQARASILWLLGEYSQLVPKIAPDVLRKMAKTFITEEDMVKLQILNLATKLYLTNEEQTKLLCEYVLTLARYDQNYDIRDRSRFLRKILFPTKENSKLSNYAKEIFLAAKPAPLIQSKFIDREEFKMGSLSHYINARAIGYQDLPPFPEIPPDASVREVPLHPTTKVQTNKHSATSKKNKAFYSDSAESTAEEASEVSADENSDEMSDDDGESSVSGTSSSEPTYTKKTRQNTKNEDSESDSDESETGDSESEEDVSDNSDGSNEDEPVQRQPKKKEPVQRQPKKKEPVQDKSKPSNIDLLLELDDLAPIAAPVMTSTQMGLFSPVSPAVSSTSITLIGPQFTAVDTFELLSKMNTAGQLSVKGRFNRVPNLFSSTMASVELHFQNHSSTNLTDIKVGQKMLGSGVSMHEFPTISNLAPSEKRVTSMGVNFNDSIQPVTFEIVWSSEDNGKSKANISIRAPVGELIRSVTVSEEYFINEHGKLKGMNEHSATLPWNLDDKLKVSRLIYEAANFGPVQSSTDNLLRFAGQTLSSTSLVLLSVLFEVENKAVITVNCEKMVVGSMILNHVKNHLSKNN